MRRIISHPPRRAHTTHSTPRHHNKHAATRRILCIRGAATRRTVCIHAAYPLHPQRRATTPSTPQRGTTTNTPQRGVSLLSHPYGVGIKFPRARTPRGAAMAPPQQTRRHAAYRFYLIHTAWASSSRVHAHHAAPHRATTTNTPPRGVSFASIRRRYNACDPPQRGVPLSSAAPQQTRAPRGVPFLSHPYGVGIKFPRARTPHRATPNTPQRGVSFHLTPASAPTPHPPNPRAPPAIRPPSCICHQC